MIPSEIIKQKRNGNEISKDQIYSFIKGYLIDEIHDYQMSALLMAIYFNGMTDEETFALTDIMLNSGKKIDFSHHTNYVADKHSTGGVGDKVSIILAPLMAAAGISIPMISGRSLGHTGGTLDKLETIPGFKVDLEVDAFQKTVDTIGIAMIGQTKDICPADRRMYSLRDVTGTVESIPLISASIMCKKIAEGIQGLVSDVKVGSGAFMKNIEDAHKLGSMLIQIGKAFNVSTDAVYSSMEQPLGKTAGLWCEIQESIDGLLGKGPDDTMEVTFELGARLLIQAGISKSKSDAIELQQKLISNSRAYEKFLEIVEYQGGNPKDIEKHDQMHIPKFSENIIAKKAGYVEKMDTYRIGLATVVLGCGRKNTSDIVDPTSGIEFYKKIGNEVQKGDVVFRIFNSDRIKLVSASEFLEKSYSIGKQKREHQLILS